MDRRSYIEMKDVTVAYDGHPVLWFANANFQGGRMTAIVGPNGAGKSTLLQAMLHMKEPIKGTVEYVFDGKASPYKQVKNKIAYVPQKASVDWDFPTTVFDVVLMGRYGHLGIGRRPSKQDKDIAYQQLDKVGMTPYADRQISQLSGGQRQRVFLARALCEQADAIILDEPLAGVDKKTEQILMRLLKEEAADGKIVIAVHHDLNTVSDYFDDVVFLNRQVITEGPVEEAFTQENIDATYRTDANANAAQQGNVPNTNPSVNEVYSNDFIH